MNKIKVTQTDIGKGVTMNRLKTFDIHPTLNIGDLHFTDKRPYEQAVLNFLDDVEKIYSKKSDIIIFSGDVVDVSKPHWDRIVGFIKKWAVRLTSQGKIIIFVQGNHELTRDNKGSAIQIFTEMEGLGIYTCYKKPEKFLIESANKYTEIACFPYLSDRNMKHYETIECTAHISITHTHSPEGLKLESLPETIFNKAIENNKDVVVFENLKSWYHLEGHSHFKNHLKDNKNYVNGHFILGVPVASRYNELSSAKSILNIESLTSYSEVELESYVKYEEVTYPKLPKGDPDLTVVDVKDAPNTKSVNEVYPKTLYNIRKIEYIARDNPKKKKKKGQKEDESNENLRDRIPTKSNFVSLMQVHAQKLELDPRIISESERVLQEAISREK